MLIWMVSHDMNRLSPLIISLLLVLSGCVVSPSADRTPFDTTKTVSPEEQPYHTPLDPSEMERNHRRALERYGSFEYRENTTTWTVNESGEMDRNNRKKFAQVNLTANTVNATLYRGDGRIERVYRNEDGDVRLDANEGIPKPTLGSEEGNPESFVIAPDSGFSTYTRSTAYNFSGVERIDGRQLYVYEAPNQTHFTRNITEISQYNRSDIITFERTLYITEDGLLYRTEGYFVVDLGDKILHSRAVLTYANLGNATVDPPAWATDESAAES